MASETQILAKGNCKPSDVIETKDLVNQTDCSGHSLLHWAVQNDNIEMCKEMLSKGCKIDQMNSLGNTPLMLASLNGATEIVKQLLQYGANPFQTNHYGAEALSMACAGNHIEIVKILSDQIGNPVESEETSWCQHPIIVSAAYKSKDCIQFLYEKDSSCINKINKISGMNALMLAEAGGFVEVKDWLVSHGAKKNPEVKQFTMQIPSPLVIPVQNMCFLFPSSPQYPSYYSQYSPAYCIKSPNVFQFPSPSINDSGSSMNFDNAGSMASLSVPSFDNSRHYCHPLTPNLCFSPSKKQSSSKDEKKTNSLYTWFKKLKRKRSKSLENLTTLKRRKSCDLDHNNILDYILSTANLSEYQSCFTDQEITFRTFLMLNEDELIEVGIKKPKVRKKFLKLIQHYKRIFHSQK